MNTNSQSNNMIDPTQETVFDFAEAPKVLADMGIRGRGGKSLTHVSVIYRWAARPDGLEFLKVGGRKFTSRQALVRFFRLNTTLKDTSKAGTDESRITEAAAAGERLNATVFRKRPR